MSDVSVVGTGAMGSALVEALAASGAEVTAWNRTKEKAEALAGPRVRVAESAADAFRKSPLAIVSVSDHEVGRTIAEEAGAALEGTVVTSTSFSTPEQAEDFATVVHAAGGSYLDLSILAYPSEVRSGAGTFFVSGDRTVYETHRERLEGIGRVSFVDEAPGAAHVSEMAVLLAYLPMAVGLLQGLRVCEHHGLPVEWFKETVLELYPSHLRSLLDRVTDPTARAAADVEASVDVWADGGAEYAAYQRQLGLDPGMYDALHRLFRVASEAGDGAADCDPRREAHDSALGGTVPCRPTPP